MNYSRLRVSNNESHAPACSEEKNSSEKSRIPINLNDLIWDLEQHYTRISKIAKNTDTDDKSFPKIYVILKDLAKSLVEIMKLKGLDYGEESLAELLSRIRQDIKKVEEVMKVARD